MFKFNSFFKLKVKVFSIPYTEQKLYKAYI